MIEKEQTKKENKEKQQKKEQKKGQKKEQKKRQKKEQKKGQKKEQKKEQKKCLVITEKHSIAKILAKILADVYGSHYEPYSDYYVVSPADNNRKYYIIWAQGPLYRLAAPEKYDKTHKELTKDTLPVIPSQFKLEPVKIPGTSKRRKAIRNLLKTYEFDCVINATDPGEEGELIFRYIVKKHKIKLPVKRLWLQALTPEHIKKAFENLREGEEFENFAQAAEARDEINWLVNINSTRAVAISNPQHVSPFVGRIHTPVLALLVDREKEIMNFQDSSYFRIIATVSQFFQSKFSNLFKVVWTGGQMPRPDRISKEMQAYKLFSKLRYAMKGNIEKIEIKTGTKRMLSLFTLPSFQRESEELWGWKAKESLAVLQMLYEGGYITYPYTDSAYLPLEMKDEIQAIAKSLLQVKEFETFNAEFVKYDNAKHIFDDFDTSKKFAEHYAIIPTGKVVELKAFSEKMRKAFELIVRRFFAVFYPPVQYFIYTVLLSIKDEPFKGGVYVIDEPGYLQVYCYDIRFLTDVETEEENNNRGDIYKYQEEIQRLQELKQYINFQPQDEIEISDIVLQEQKTNPPVRYTDGTLIDTVRGIGRTGLGTVMTRPAIIDVLIEHNYIEREGIKLRPTPRGVELINYLQQLHLDVLTIPEQAAEWEYLLSLIKEGKYDKQELRKKIENLTREIVNTFFSEQDKKKIKAFVYKTNQILGKCPYCGGNVVERDKGYFCENFFKKDKKCNFVIWKHSWGGNISREQAQKLLKQGITSPLTLRSKRGRIYKARLLLTENGRILPEFLVKQEKVKQGGGK